MMILGNQALVYLFIFFSILLRNLKPKTNSKFIQIIVIKPSP